MVDIAANVCYYYSNDNYRNNHNTDVWCCQGVSDEGGSTMANEALKRHARAEKVFLWEVAEQFGISESTFCKRLRRELPPEERDLVMKKIREIAETKRAK